MDNDTLRRRIIFLETQAAELLDTLAMIGISRGGIPDEPFDKDTPIAVWHMQRIDKYEDLACAAIANYAEAASKDREDQVV